MIALEGEEDENTELRGDCEKIVLEEKELELIL